MQYWYDFRALPYTDEILIALGALVTLLAVIRIVQSSLRMFFWVLLAGFGLSAVAYGSGNMPWQESTLPGIQLSDIVGPGKEMSRDVLRLLCIKLEEAREG